MTTHTDSPLSGLTPGLYFDESGRTLPEVTAALADCLEEQGLYQPLPFDREVLGHISQDPHSGLYWADEGWEEAVGWVYETLADIITENTADDLYWAYENEAGGWGLWTLENEEGWL